MTVSSIAATDHAFAIGTAQAMIRDVDADRATRIRSQVQTRAYTCESWLPLWRALNANRGESADLNTRIALDPTAHRFRAGSRIRVLIAGGSHPRFARNLGTGEPLVSGRELKASTHTVHLGEGGVSRLLLPAGPHLP